MKMKHMQLNLAAKTVERTVESLKTAYVNPYRQPVPVKDFGLQVRELDGEVEQGKGLYHNQAFEDTVHGLRNLRTELRTATAEDRRRSLLTSAYGLWSGYLQRRFGELPEELQFTEGMRKNLFSAFEHHRDRNEGVLLPAKVQEMHFEFASLFKFNPVIDVQYIEQMIHPSRGYLCHLPSGLSFDQLLGLYETLIVATFEKLSGQSLLGHRLSALGYWNLLDKRAAGYLDFGSMLALLRTVRFSRVNTREDFEREFARVLRANPGQFVAGEDRVVGLECFMGIFLERNL